jgi:hypothetical protein
VAAPICDWKELQTPKGAEPVVGGRCILKGYTFGKGQGGGNAGGHCYSCNGNPQYAVDTLVGFGSRPMKPHLFRKWLTDMNARNGGDSQVLSESAVVKEYTERCDVETGLTIPACTNEPPSCNWRDSSKCIFPNYVKVSGYLALDLDKSVDGACVPCKTAYAAYMANRDRINTRSPSYGK